MVIVTFYLGQGCLREGGLEGLGAWKARRPLRLPSGLALCKGGHQTVFRQQAALRPAQA